MKFHLPLSAFAVFLVTVSSITSCSETREQNNETARKQVIDAEANELIETENLEIVDQLLNLDVTLDELDMSLQGEAGKFTEGLEETNYKLSETREMLIQLKNDLYNKADTLETLRRKTIEPLVSEALTRNDADQEHNQP